MFCTINVCRLYIFNRFYCFCLQHPHLIVQHPSTAEAADIAENLKVATLINALRGQIKQHLLLNIRPSHTWQQVRDIVENYFSNAYFPSSSGHGMHNVSDDINASKGKKKGKGKGRNWRRKKAKEKNKGGYNNTYNNNYNKGGVKGKGKTSKGKEKNNYYNSRPRHHNNNRLLQRNNNKVSGKTWSAWSNSNNNNNIASKSKWKGNKSLWCTNCNKSGHTSDKCWCRTGPWPSFPVRPKDANLSVRRLSGLRKLSSLSLVRTAPAQLTLVRTTLWNSLNFGMSTPWGRARWYPLIHNKNHHGLIYKVVFWLIENWHQPSQEFRKQGWQPHFGTADVSN